MRIDGGRLNWGVFLIVLGAVPLAYHLGLVDAGTIRGLWRLWPLVLVGIGLGLVLSRTPAFFMGGLVVAACLGLVFGSLFAVAPSFGCGSDREPGRASTHSGSFEGISRVELTLPCGIAAIGRSSDTDWHVTTARAGGSDARVSGSGPRLSVRVGNEDWWLDRGWNSWRIEIPAQTVSHLSATTDAGESTLDISDVSFSSAAFTLNAGSLRVNLDGVSLGSASFTTNAGSSDIRLDSRSEIASGSITTNAGETQLCVASGLGLQIKSTETLASSNLDESGLVRSGDAWRTTDYDQALHKVNLEATTNAGSFEISIGGC
jgi:hypothetical protein